MSKYDEKEIIRQLEKLSEVEPKLELTLGAMQDMRSRLEGKSSEVRTKRLKLLSQPFVRFAIAAGVIIAIGLFALRFNSGQQNGKEQFADNGYVSSCVSMIELRQAYYRGGVDEIERQYDQVYSRFDENGNGVSANEIIDSL